MINQENFINSMLAISSIWIIKIYLDNIFIERENVKYWKATLWTALLAFQFLLEKGKGEASILVILINICLVTFLCIFIYEGGVRKSLLYITLLYAMWILSEFSVFLFFKVMPQNNQILVLGSIISKIIMFLLLIFLKFFLQNKSKHLIPLKYWGLLFLIPISSIYISYNILLLEEHNDKMSLFTIVSFLLIVFINLIVFEICENCLKT